MRACWLKWVGRDWSISADYIWLNYSGANTVTKVSRCILAEKATMVVDHIAYHKLDERYDSTIFAERIPGNVGRALETSRCIQDYVFWDSEGERCDVVHSYEDLLTVIQGTD